MSSTNLNLSLQDYLGKSSQKNTSSLSNLSGSLKSSLSDLKNNSKFDRLYSWVGAASSNDLSSSYDVQNDDAVNGWFAQASKDPFLPSLSKKQRVVGFFIFLLTGTLCFSIASLYVPFLVLKARKFALLYSLGSFFVIFSFSMLWGPLNHLKHLFHPTRLPFTLSYFATMTATIYFALFVRSYVLTLLFAVLQMLALVWYIVSYIPGGQRGLKFFSQIFYVAVSKTASKTLPI